MGSLASLHIMTLLVQSSFCETLLEILFSSLETVSTARRKWHAVLCLMRWKGECNHYITPACVVLVKLPTQQMMGCNCKMIISIKLIWHCWLNAAGTRNTRQKLEQQNAVLNNSSPDIVKATQVCALLIHHDRLVGPDCKQLRFKVVSNEHPT